MPKEKRRRSGAHEQSVRLPTRQFAVQDNAVEHVEPGTQTEASGSDLLRSMAEAEPRTAMKKKEKQALKHELFLKRLESTRSPYSKSHDRRMKRKAKEQVAGGMGDVKAALSALEDEIPQAVADSIQEDISGDTASEDRPKSKPKPKPKQIGKGKGAPLSKAQRKRMLETERMRIPIILSTPEFAANPFQTIRTHAQNTLVKHQTPD